MAVGLGPFEYDGDVLQFTGFANKAVFTVAPFATTYNEDLKLISIGWQTAQDFSAGVKLCDLCFKVIGEGDCTVTGKPVVKNEAAKDISSSVPKPSASVSASLKSITGLTFSSASYTYDGTEKALAVSGTLPAGASVAYTNERATAAGTYNATAPVTCEGYSTLNLTATLTIRPKELKIDGLRARNKTYDATDAATLTGGTLTGVLTGDTVSAAIPTAGKFASVDAGTGIAVSIDPITLTGATRAATP